MARKVIWSIGASLDKDEILKYWLLRNRTYSYPRKLNKLFHQTLKLLSKNPELGRKNFCTRNSFQIGQRLFVLQILRQNY